MAPINYHILKKLNNNKTTNILIFLVVTNYSLNHKQIAINLFLEILGNIIVRLYFKRDIREQGNYRKKINFSK